LFAAEEGRKGLSTRDPERGGRGCAGCDSEVKKGNPCLGKPAYRRENRGGRRPARTCNPVGAFLPLHHCYRRAPTPALGGCHLEHQSILEWCRSFFCALRLPNLWHPD